MQIATKQVEQKSQATNPNFSGVKSGDKPNKIGTSSRNCWRF